MLLKELLALEECSRRVSSEAKESLYNHFLSSHRNDDDQFPAELVIPTHQLCQQCPRFYGLAQLLQVIKIYQQARPQRTPQPPKFFEYEQG